MVWFMRMHAQTAYICVRGSSVKSTLDRWPCQNAMHTAHPLRCVASDTACVVFCLEEGPHGLVVRRNIHPLIEMQARKPGQKRKPIHLPHDEPEHDEPEHGLRIDQSFPQIGPDGRHCLQARVCRRR